MFRKLSPEVKGTLIGLLSGYVFQVGFWLTGSFWGHFQLEWKCLIPMWPFIILGALVGWFSLGMLGISWYEKWTVISVYLFIFLGIFLTSAMLELFYYPNLWHMPLTWSLNVLAGLAGVWYYRKQLEKNN